MFWTGFVTGAACMFVLLAGFAFFSRWYMQRVTARVIKDMEEETRK
jgi:hypothetical protein